jgi:type III secretory pathway component EscS
MDVVSNQDTSPQTTAVRRPRHLLDPANLHQSHRSSQSSHESLTSVQRWVMSVLAVTTILHLSVGLVVAAIYMDDSRLDARIGLNVIAAVVAILAVAVGRVIHQKNPLSAWLLLGLVPGAVGLWLTLA